MGQKNLPISASDRLSHPDPLRTAIGRLDLSIQNCPSGCATAKVRLPAPSPLVVAEKPLGVWGQALDRAECVHCLGSNRPKYLPRARPWSSAPFPNGSSLRIAAESWFRFRRPHLPEPC